MHRLGANLLHYYGASCSIMVFLCPLSDEFRAFLCEPKLARSLLIEERRSNFPSLFTTLMRS
jgi:hypothetical protein